MISSLGLRPCLSALLVLLGLLTPNLARADCADATAALDKLICNTPDIAEKDRALNEKYRAAMALLSDAGKQNLRNGQRKWLTLVRTICGSRIGQPADIYGNSADNCLRREYDARLAQLDGAATQIGPYLLSRIDDFAFKSRTADDALSGFRTRVYGRPYIDQPATPETAAWNKRVEYLAQQTERDLLSEHFESDVSDRVLDMGSMTVSFTMGLGGEKLLSVMLDAFMYADGFGHGWGKASASTWLLKPGREMTLAEIFRPGTDWQAAIRAECGAELKMNESAKDTSCSDAGADTGWIPTGRGPQMLVFLDAVPFMNVYGLAPVDLTWANLRPLLRSDLPFAIPPE